MKSTEWSHQEKLEAMDHQDDEPEEDFEYLHAVQQIKIVKGFMILSLIFSGFTFGIMLWNAYEIQDLQHVSPFPEWDTQGFQEPVDLTAAIPMIIPIIANPFWIITMLLGLMFLKTYPFTCLLSILAFLTIYVFSSILFLPGSFFAMLGGLFFFAVCLANLPIALIVQRKRSIPPVL